jgi:hypothetical protein
LASLGDRFASQQSANSSCQKRGVKKCLLPETWNICPIVDVIQLLHATKKSGTLSVRGHKGESQLVFDGGYIVSANHSNASLRIGKILVKTRAITQETLSQVLLDQKNAGKAVSL